MGPQIFLYALKFELFYPTVLNNTIQIKCFLWCIKIYPLNVYIYIFFLFYFGSERFKDRIFFYKEIIIFVCG